MNPESRAKVERVAGKPVASVSPLAGGCIAEVYRVDLEGGATLAVKVSQRGGLECEAWMLGYLAERSSLPVPRVVYGDDRLLAMEFIANDGAAIRPSAEEHAAELLAALHEVPGDSYGLERDTLIGSLDQPNSPSASWVEFFRERRLMEFGRRAMDAGSLAPPAFGRLEALCAKLGDWIDEPPRPSLIHGDMWGGNVLVASGKIAGFVDPAVYYADAEIELAFSTLFSTFGDPFFRRYEEIRSLAPGFFEARRDIYNLYPLLVHAVLFGSSYGASVDSTLKRFVG